VFTDGVVCAVGALCGNLLAVGALTDHKDPMTQGQLDMALEMKLKTWEALLALLGNSVLEAALLDGDTANSIWHSLAQGMAPVRNPHLCKGHATLAIHLACAVATKTHVKVPVDILDTVVFLLDLFRGELEWHSVRQGLRLLSLGVQRGLASASSVCTIRMLNCARGALEAHKGKPHPMVVLGATTLLLQMGAADFMMVSVIASAVKCVVDALLGCAPLEAATLVQALVLLENCVRCAPEVLPDVRDVHVLALRCVERRAQLDPAFSEEVLRVFLVYKITCAEHGVGLDPDEMGEGGVGVGVGVHVASAH